MLQYSVRPIREDLKDAWVDSRIASFAGQGDHVPTLCKAAVDARLLELSNVSFSWVPGREPSRDEYLQATFRLASPTPTAIKEKQERIQSYVTKRLRQLLDFRQIHGMLHDIQKS